MTLVVCIGALMTALVLSWSAPLPPERGEAEIMALVAPSEVFLGETVAVRATASVAGEVRLERRFRVCALETGECRTAGWGSVQGPIEWAGFAGHLAPWRPGQYAITWSLYAPWASDVQRAVTRVTLEVTAVATPD